MTKRRNSISGQFTARLIEMLESPAYRVLSRSAHMAIARVEIELARVGFVPARTQIQRERRNGVT